MILLPSEGTLGQISSGYVGSEGTDTLRQQRLVNSFLHFSGVKYEVLPEISLLRIYPKEMIRDLDGIMCLSLFIKFGDKLNVLQQRFTFKSMCKGAGSIWEISIFSSILL